MSAHPGMRNGHHTVLLPIGQQLTDVKQLRDHAANGCRKNKKKVNSQVLFFERTALGNKVYPIEIMENGEYSEKQPKSFRRFFVLEELDLLGVR